MGYGQERRGRSGGYEGGGGVGSRDPGKRALTDGLRRTFLRDLLRGKKTAPASVPEEAIRTTSEFRAYMDHNLVWQWQLHVTESEAIAACRHVLADLASGKRITWPGEARKYINAVRGTRAPAPEASTDPTQEPSSSDMGPVCETELIDESEGFCEAEPAAPAPTPDEPERKKEKPDEPEKKRITDTPILKPDKETEESFRKRLDDAEKFLEKLKRAHSELADQVERDVKRARDLFSAAASLFAVGVILVFVPGGEAYVLNELQDTLDDIDRMRGEWETNGEKTKPPVPLDTKNVTWESLTKEEFWKWRRGYEFEVRAIKPKAMVRVAGGEDVEAVARWANQERIDLGWKYKMLMPPDMLQDVLARNLEKYQNEKGPSAEWVYERVKSAKGNAGLSERDLWLKVIDSSATPGGEDILPKLVKMIEDRTKAK